MTGHVKCPGFWSGKNGGKILVLGWGSQGWPEGGKLPSGTDGSFKGQLWGGDKARENLDHTLLLQGGNSEAPGGSQGDGMHASGRPGSQNNSLRKSYLYQYFCQLHTSPAFLLKGQLSAWQIIFLPFHMGMDVKIPSPPISIHFLISFHMFRQKNTFYCFPEPCGFLS